MLKEQRYVKSEGGTANRNEVEEGRKRRLSKKCKRNRSKIIRRC
jgi:hypothetical protein